MISIEDEVSSGGILGGQYWVLSDNEIEQFYLASLDILYSTGMAIYSSKALDVLNNLAPKSIVPFHMPGFLKIWLKMY
jgi:hypothetical protein